jgi:hypothetical protein
LGKIKDEFTGYSWDYFVYDKSTASVALENKLTWLRGKGLWTKVIRCDNAKEHIGLLRKVANRFGRIIEYVAPYTPQQNGKVERQFPTDLHRANSMMDAANLTTS